MKRRLLPSVASELYYHLATIHEDWIDVDGRQIWIHGIGTSPELTDGEEPGVEYQMATKVIKNLHILLKSSTTKPVTIHLHTCGGDVVEGMAIYDAIRAMPYKVTMISYTHARSMSSIILQAADKRILLPNSYFMFHDGTMWVSGTAKSVKSYVDFSQHSDNRMLDIYSERLKAKGKFKGRSKEYICKQLREYMDKKEDVYLPAKEAIEWGFADALLHKFPI